MDPICKVVVVGMKNAFFQTANAIPQQFIYAAFGLN